MRYAIGALMSASYQHNDCSDRVEVTCNRVTVLAGYSHPYRDQEIPLLFFPCLLKLLYKSKWLLKEEGPRSLLPNGIWAVTGPVTAGCSGNGDADQSLA